MRQSLPADSVVLRTKKMQFGCVLCYIGLEKPKKESIAGHFDKDSDFTEKKSLSTRKLHKEPTHH
jgi:hypothetical protein